MKVYNYDTEGYLIGVSELDDSDKCQITGNWLMPAMTTDKNPLEQKEGYKIKFVNNAWEYEKILTDEEKKINGELALDEGEKIVESTLIKVEKPSELYSWNYDTKEWYLDDEKVRISKLPTEEEVLSAKIELKTIEILTELRMI